RHSKRSSLASSCGRRRSRLAARSRCISALVVANSTGCPCSTSAWPRALMRWLFPAPGRPMATTLIASVRKLPSRKRSICIRAAAAKRLRSSVRKFLPGSKPESRRRRSTRRADLAARSVRASSSRNASWLSPSLAARRAVSSTALAIAPKLSPRSNTNNSSRGLTMLAARGEQGVVVAEVDRRLGDRRRRGGLAAAGEFAHRLEGRRATGFKQQVDRQFDFGFRGAGRQVKEPQVLGIGLGRDRREQLVI